MVQNVACESAKVVITDIAGNVLSQSEHAVGSSVVRVLVASRLPQFASLVIGVSVFRHSDELPLAPGAVVHATLVRDESIRIELFYRASGMPFYALPEMTFHLQVAEEDFQAPLHLALCHWAKEYRDAGGLLEYVSRACGFLASAYTDRRNLFCAMYADRHVDVYLQVDPEPSVAFNSGVHYVAGGRADRPDEQLLQRSPTLPG